MKFFGSLVALITPYTKQGRIDRDKIQKLVQWHREEGTQGIICTGSTGEAAALSSEERLEVISACLEAAEKKISIIAGTGTSDTAQSVRFTESAQKMGVDGAMVITPYFNKPSQRGCFLHFREVARVGLPLIVYNNPGRCVVNLEPETIAELAQLPQIVALKEANHDLAHFAKVRSLTSLPLLAGEDLLTYEMLHAGAVGAVSVVGNVLPNLWSEMIRLKLEGEEKRSEKLFQRALPLIKALSLEPNPQGVKKALSLLRRAEASLRLPLLEMSDENACEIKRAFSRLFFPFWTAKALTA